MTSIGTVVRRGAISERAALEELQRRASLVREDYREELLAHPDAIELPIEHIASGRTYVAERQGQVVGFSVVLRRPDGDAELDGLFVEPDCWGQGIGKHLVRAVAQLAASEGAKSIYVVANPRAERFYDARGFELIGEQSTRFGAALLMRKRLVSHS